VLPSDVRRGLTCSLILWSVVTPLFAIDSDRDFSGNWILDFGRSTVRPLGVEPETFLTVTQSETAIHCATAIEGAEASWSYRLDGNDSRYKYAAETRNSAIKWEGSALLINTLVSGAGRSYTVMDRWRLSPSHTMLTITRQIVRSGGEVEGVLVYRRAGADVTEAPGETRQSIPRRVAPANPAAPILTPRPAAAPATSGERKVAAGTRVLLELTHSLNTKRSHDGDRVHLRVAFPVSVEDHVVIPRGSTVLGTVTQVKGAKGKGDLYIRFDTLTLPDGKTRDLRARPEGGGEGKIAGGDGTAGDARKVATGAGIGASIGGIAGAASGHAGAGMGIGGLAGAAAGLASVFSKGGPDVTLHEGTTVEMVLDRELRF
jgi:hypothetical protein